MEKEICCGYFRSVLRAVAPADTFIAADDFNSTQELAKYLNEVSSNKEKYLRFNG